MSLKKEIYSNYEIVINGQLYREIKILGIRLRFKLKRSSKIIPHKYKVKSRYLQQKQKVSPFKLEERSDLYDIYLNSTGKNINKMHHYFPIYYKHFLKYRNKPVNILEIGVCEGGSVKMWRDFFGKEAVIYGVDIDPECKKFENPENGLYIKIADQSSREDLRKLMKELPQIDIVIDDGGHTTNQQITSFDEIYDKIAPDGVYLVEDLHTNYWKDFIDSKHTFIEHAKEHIDALNAWFFDKTDDRYRNLEGKEQMEMPVFTNITHGIHFYNSIIVFEKQNTCIPFSEKK